MPQTAFLCDHDVRTNSSAAVCAQHVELTFDTLFLNKKHCPPQPPYLRKRSHAPATGVIEEDCAKHKES